MSRNGNDAIYLDCHEPFYQLTGDPQVCKPCLAKEVEKKEGADEKDKPNVARA